MINWKLEVEDVACLVRVDDMKTTDCSEFALFHLEGMDRGREA